MAWAKPFQSFTTLPAMRNPVRFSPSWDLQAPENRLFLTLLQVDIVSNHHSLYFWLTGGVSCSNSLVEKKSACLTRQIPQAVTWLTYTVLWFSYSSQVFKFLQPLCQIYFKQVTSCQWVIFTFHVLYIYSMTWMMDEHDSGAHDQTLINTEDVDSYANFSIPLGCDCTC